MHTPYNQPVPQTRLIIICSQIKHLIPSHFLEPDFYNLSYFHVSSFNYIYVLVVTYIAL